MAVWTEYTCLLVEPATGQAQSTLRNPGEQEEGPEVKGAPLGSHSDTGSCEPQPLISQGASEERERSPLSQHYLENGS